MDIQEINKMEINIYQSPGEITFSNLELFKEVLSNCIKPYKDIIYASDELKDALNDLKKLRTVRKKIYDKKKEIEKLYNAPLEIVKKQIDELLEIIDEPINKINSFVKYETWLIKQKEIETYKLEKSVILGKYAHKIINSPVFNNPKWENSTFSLKQCKDEIDKKISQAQMDLKTIQLSAGKHSSILMARYFETLSLDNSDKFLRNLDIDSNEIINDLNNQDSLRGYKILKVFGTDSEIASLLSDLKIRGIEFEELEDGMPKQMEELVNPNFDSFVSFDIETTGTFGSKKGDDEARIVEIGAVKVISGQIVDVFDELINPQREIVPFISKITNITNDMIKDKPSSKEILSKFKVFCGDAILIGHNIKSSDLHYILKEAKQAGINFDNSFLDTYILAKKFKDTQKWEKLNLEYLSTYFGIKHENAHRAYNDAEVNAEIYMRLKELSETLS